MTSNKFHNIDALLAAGVVGVFWQGDDQTCKVPDPLPSAGLTEAEVQTRKRTITSLMASTAEALLEVPSLAGLNSIRVEAGEFAIVADEHGGEVLAVAHTKGHPVAKSIRRMMRSYFGFARKDAKRPSTCASETTTTAEGIL